MTRDDARAPVGGAAAAAWLLAATGPGDLEVLKLRDNFFLIAGAGGHIGVQVGDDGVVVVDAGSAARADDVVAAIRKITPRPIRYVINTSADADHVGGNETLTKAGQTLFTSGDFLRGAASILAAEQVLLRMSAPTGQASPFEVHLGRSNAARCVADRGHYEPELRDDRSHPKSGRGMCSSFASTAVTVRRCSNPVRCRSLFGPAPLQHDSAGCRQRRRPARRNVKQNGVLESGAATIFSTYGHEPTYATR